MIKLKSRSYSAEVHYDNKKIKTDIMLVVTVLSSKRSHLYFKQTKPP